jgi:hypothetical protein
VNAYARQQSRNRDHGDSRVFFAEGLAKGLLLRRRAYSAAARLDEVDPAGEIHRNSRFWKLLGPGGRTVPEGALVHASVRERVDVDPAYCRAPAEHLTYTNEDWRTPRPWPKANS